eukprot:CAMPEP_0117451704 /NCGR_PEP_ID=MMETSP0759-20121206/9157_1 /TAXON_ID=63605 /ORGANISM="Percolomonas cosmopolitus, Strain WS" /LENGTH=337 /DNA_ID=CAMNT_0005244337 /DNA_START=8 /DNA_END=1021 /DNA_ORIENTATION=-
MSSPQSPIILPSDPHKHAQLANAVLMVRPTSFKFNIESFETNPNQKNIQQNNAMEEFAASVKLLTDNGVHVIVMEDVSEYDKVWNDERSPDEIFPNNVFGTMPDGSIIVYPMLNRNRQLEAKRLKHIRSALAKENYQASHVVELLHGPKGEALEGTGSLVIDHDGGVVYMARSERSSPLVLKRFMNLHSKYYKKAVCFDSVQSQERGQGMPFYHTNVVMSIGEGFALVCLESIKDETERQLVVDTLKESGKEVIDVSLKQTEESFCCNALEVRTRDGQDKVIIMSESAQKGFTTDQLKRMKDTGSKIVALPITTIEQIGGGSARCMCMEVWKDRNNA